PAFQSHFTPSATAGEGAGPEARLLVDGAAPAALGTGLLPGALAVVAHLGGAFAAAGRAGGEGLGIAAGPLAVDALGSVALADHADPAALALAFRALLGAHGAGDEDQEGGHHHDDADDDGVLLGVAGRRRRRRRSHLPQLGPAGLARGVRPADIGVALGTLRHGIFLLVRLAALPGAESAGPRPAPYSGNDCSSVPAALIAIVAVLASSRRLPSSLTSFAVRSGRARPSATYLSRSWSFTEYALNDSRRSMIFFRTVLISSGSLRLTMSSLVVLI